MPTRLETWGARLLAGETPATPLTQAILGFLAGCAWLYDTGLEAYLAAEGMGLRRRTRLSVPVVSIGNLTVGGTGKTPMTQRLCRLLQEHGRQVAVLSRGHGGAGTSVRVVSDRQGQCLLGADDAGDEPFLLAHTLPGVPVLVGKDRRVSGREAIGQFASDVLVLDDGFQFWQLARDLDMVLLDARHPFDNGYVLPRGLLREPKRHLNRAQMIVVTRADTLNVQERESLRHEIGGLAPKAKVFWAKHQAQGFVQTDNLAGPLRPLNLLQGQSVVALSGIAQPGSFIRSLTEEAKAQVVQHLIFSDHARYGPDEVAAVRKAVGEGQAKALVMTEKDAVKWPNDIFSVPVYALRTVMQVEDEAGWADAVLRLLPREQA